MTSRRWQRLVSLALVTVLVGAVGDVPIVDAAKNSDRDALRTLLEQGADVNARAGDGATALLWASYRDDMDSAELLIGAGADVDLANDLGATPLWAASRNGSPAMAGLLLEAGADPDAPLLLGETPLITAARTGNPQVVRMLLEAGAEVNARGARGQTPLMFAAAQRHPDAVKLLLEYGADVTLRTHVWNQLRAQSPHAHPEHQLWVLHGGNDALMFAARVGDAESAKHLITAGADVNAKSAWGLTPLVMAAYADFGDQWLIREQTTNNLIYFDRDQILPGQFGELVEFLLEQGADPNVGAERYSPLIMAVLRKNEEAVELLLGHGQTRTPRSATSRPSNVGRPRTTPCTGPGWGPVPSGSLPGSVRSASCASCWSTEPIRRSCMRASTTADAPAGTCRSGSKRRRRR